MTRLLRRPPPARLRSGVYRPALSRINKWELYEGLRLVAEHHFCRGQGEGIRS